MVNAISPPVDESALDAPDYDWGAVAAARRLPPLIHRLETFEDATTHLTRPQLSVAPQRWRHCFFADQAAVLWSFLDDE